MLRLHIVQVVLKLCDSGKKEILLKIPSVRRFVWVRLGEAGLLLRRGGKPGGAPEPSAEGPRPGARENGCGGNIENG